MGECVSTIKEVRFVIDPEITHAYVHCEAVGDCPLGVQGWHYKAFPGSRTIIDIFRNEIPKYLEWSQKAP